LNGLSSLRLAPLVLAGLEILAGIGIMGVFHKGAADPRGRDIAHGIMGLTLLPLAPCVMPALFLTLLDRWLPWALLPALAAIPVWLPPMRGA
jgi:hypothetical protein